MPNNFSEVDDLMWHHASKIIHRIISSLLLMQGVCTLLNNKKHSYECDFCYLINSAKAIIFANETWEVSEYGTI